MKMSMVIGTEKATSFIGEESSETVQDFLKTICFKDSKLVRVSEDKRHPEHDHYYVKVDGRYNDLYLLLEGNLGTRMTREYIERISDDEARERAEYTPPP